VRLKLFEPFRLQVRLSLWLFWAAIALAVISIGSRSAEPNPPTGLFLLGAGLLAPGALAALALVSSTLWNALIDTGLEVPPARRHLYGILALGAGGAVLIGFALHRLL